ncbi:MAG: hydroxyacid dehydrogenase [Bacteroidetes bacterium]|nr:hydroxyacid dehydrogenase [Bacteroidota bacterium]
MHILFYSHLVSEFGELVEPLKEAYPEHTFVFAKNKEQYRAELHHTEVLIYGNLSPEDAELAPNLKLLIVPFTGIAHLDPGFFKKQGILVANSPGNGPTVAERALALAMATCGRLVEFHNDMAAGNWHRTGDPQKPFDYWFSMLGKRVSILGTGDIGQGVARLLQGFDCRIMGFRKGKDLPEYFDSVTTSVDEALEFAEILFVVLPLNPETDNLINQSNIDKLRGKIMVNVSRGSIVNEEALYNSLANGEMRGAGIDVWYDYPSKKRPQTTGSEYPFHKLPNVVMSPHAGSHAPEGKMGQLKGALLALETYLKNGVPVNLVSRTD